MKMGEEETLQGANTAFVASIGLQSNFKCIHFLYFFLDVHLFQLEGRSYTQEESVFNR